MKTVLCYGDSNTWGYDRAERGALSLRAALDQRPGA